MLVEEGAFLSSLAIQMVDQGMSNLIRWLVAARREGNVVREEEEGCFYRCLEWWWIVRVQ